MSSSTSAGALAYALSLQKVATTSSAAVHMTSPCTPPSALLSGLMHTPASALTAHVTPAMRGNHLAAASFGITLFRKAQYCVARRCT